MLPTKYFFRLLTGALIATICFLVIYSATPLGINYVRRNERNEDTKYILYWTTMLGSETWHFDSNGSKVFRNCEYKNCFVTTDKNVVPIDAFAAVLFYIPIGSPLKYEPLPSRRSPNQRYIFASSEAPIRFRKPLVQYLLNDFYNWTMTYRFDSDILRRHGFIVKTDTNYVMPTVEDIKKKKRSVAWFVSNCNSTNRREHIGRQLKKYIDVDVYGRCGNLSCPSSNDCYEMLERNYLFYLSFENSHCNDYATEKLYKTLKRNVIPVVYGGADYDKMTPPQSVINVGDFKSVKSLANYLKNLANDIPRYLEYFKWKQHYKVEINNKRAVCQLCKKLNDPTEPPKQYGDIVEWWFGKEMSQCSSERSLPRIAFS